MKSVDNQFDREHKQEIKKPHGMLKPPQNQFWGGSSFLYVISVLSSLPLAE